MHHRRPYDLRHTFASLLLAAGAPMAYVGDPSRPDTEDTKTNDKEYRLRMAKARSQLKLIRREPQSNSSFSTTEEVIAQRAYALYLSRGAEDGHDVEDWLQAEREIQEAKNAKSADEAR